MDDKAKEVTEKIIAQIKDSCAVSKYSSICKRISTEAGLAYVTNRCITMMKDYGFHLDTALAQLESELEGIN